MGRYEVNTRGDLDDRVRLLLGGDELIITEGYDVHQGVLTQPAAFSIRIGSGSIVAALAEKYPPRTKFQLFIGDGLRFTGYTDGYTAAGENGATELTVNGRDILAQLHDAYIKADKTYKDRTYGELVFSVLKDALVDATLIVDTNVENRLTQAGLAGVSSGAAGASTRVDPIIAPTPQEALGKGVAAIVAAAQAQQAPPEEDAAATQKRLDANKPKNAKGTMQAKAGERYYEFLKKELDRAGLCLWSTADGEAFVLTAPDGQQRPIARLVRKRGGGNGNLVNVLHARHTNDSSKRFSEVIVYARSGGGKKGRTVANAKYEDAEMKAWGFNRPLVLRDAKCANEKQAEYLARRKMAECRRSGWNLSYTVAGHTFPVLGTGERGTWTPDTVVDVDDDELGLYGSFYVEQVAFKRSPQTTTDLTLLRPADLIFAEEFPE